MKLTEKESLWLQSLAITSLLGELHNNDFLHSKYFRKLDFPNPQNKAVLLQSGLGNPATMQMMLYAMFVLAKDCMLAPDASKLLTQCINRYATSSLCPSHTLLPFIEAIQKGAVTFDNEKGTVTFDEQITMKTQSIGILLMVAQKQIMMYFNTKQQP